MCNYFYTRAYLYCFKYFNPEAVWGGHACFQTQLWGGEEMGNILSLPAMLKFQACVFYYLWFHTKRGSSSPFYLIALTCSQYLKSGLDIYIPHNALIARKIAHAFRPRHRRYQLFTCCSIKHREPRLQAGLHATDITCLEQLSPYVKNSS